MSSNANEKTEVSGEGGEAAGGNGQMDDLMKVLPLVNSGALVLLLLLALFSAFAVYGVSDRMSTLESQSRKMLKATQALEEELVLIKDMVEAASARSPAHAAAARASPAAGGRIETPKAGSDCVIRSGDPKGLAECMNH